MAKEEAVVEESQQVRRDFARIQSTAGCRAAGGATAVVLESQRAGGPHTETEVHFAQAGGCLRTAEEVRMMFDRRPRSALGICISSTGRSQKKRDWAAGVGFIIILLIVTVIVCIY